MKHATKPPARPGQTPGLLTRLSAQNALRRQIFCKAKLPAIRPKENKLHYTGRPFVLSVTDLFVPSLRLEEQTWERREFRKSDRMFVSLNGADGPVVQKCRYDPQKKTITFDLPKQARSGPAVLFLPAEERYGSSDPAVNQRSREITGTGKTFAKIPRQALRQFMFPGAVFLVRMTCGGCLTHSLCPNGAIKFDRDGFCYVDQEVCQGQKRISVDGVMTEQKCWRCFPPGHTSPVSARCTYRLLAKTLYLDTGCCGCCSDTRKVIPGMCLKQFCGRGAIGGGYPVQVVDPDTGEIYTCERCPGQIPSGIGEPPYYTVNQAKCAGCMTCYNNILCYHPRMKARIRSKLVMVRLKYIVLDPLCPPIPAWCRNGLYLGVWGETKGGPYFREIKLEFNRQWRALVGREFAASSSASFMVYQKGRNGFKMPLSLDIRPALQTVDLGNLQKGSFETEIRTQLGSFTLGLEG